MQRPFFVFVMSILSCLVVGPVQANDLSEAVKRMAKNIQSFLAADGQNILEMRDFSGPGTGGRAIRAALERELKEQGLEVVALGANSQLRGDFQLKEDNPGILVIRAIMVDRAGREISTFREKVKDEEVTDVEDITRVLGSTVDLRQEGQAEDGGQNNLSESNGTDSDGGSENADGAAEKTLTSVSKDQASKIEQSQEKPAFVASGELGSVIAASENSPFKIELLVRRNGASDFVPLKMEDQGGFSFASLEDGDVYRIGVYNDADHDVGVKISIDGINTFVLSEVPEFRELGAWVLRSRRKMVVTGWYVDPGRALEFLVSSSGDQGRLPPPSDIGTITAQFFHAWGAGDPTPAVERVKFRSQQTVAGRKVPQKSGIGRAHIGKQLLGSVSLRYKRPPVDLPDTVN